MGWFKDLPITPHPDLGEVRFAIAGRPSAWKRTRHRWLSAISLVAGLYLGIHFSVPSAPTTSARPCSHASAFAHSQTTTLHPLPHSKP
jgi:hypothetical protein